MDRALPGAEPLGPWRYIDYGSDTHKVDGATINTGFDSSEVLTGIALRFQAAGPAGAGVMPASG